ncbi:hypothetical protein PRZ48_014575 [Zasmidium cellare]|uniref:Uncharacterized protein n=1 Tax=Zasmidium cellare TaxID=395010 RepID=A0ABR0DYM3_ZASCE|nr:hypothetical protein PRZ48_014575 [Zasmidium cellare]
MSAHLEATQGEPVPLRLHLEGLPQELYDQIYDLTFTAQPGIRYASKPPKGASEEGLAVRPLHIAPDHVGLLHVDRHSRDKFARSYYGGEGAVFVCDITGRVHNTQAYWTPWIASINQMHRSLIKDVRLVFAKCDVDSYEKSFREHRAKKVADRVKGDLGSDTDSTVQTGDEGEITGDLENFQEPEKTKCGRLRPPDQTVAAHLD